MQHLSNYYLLNANFGYFMTQKRNYGSILYSLYIVSNPCIFLVFIQTILGNDAQIHVSINGMTISNMQTFLSFYF